MPESVYPPHSGKANPACPRTDYSSEMLDELLATGAVIWSGQKKLGEDDRLVALHLQEYAAESFTPAEAIRRIVRRCNKR
ncbi:hypothetical protein ACNKHP_00335 [Shigella boydii]